MLGNNILSLITIIMCTKQSSCTHKYNCYKLLRPAIAIIMCLLNMANRTVGFISLEPREHYNSSTVTWLKGWDRLSLALQCIPQALIRDLTIQQQNYLTTREGTASEFIDTPKSIVLPYFMFSRTQIWSSYVVVAKEKKFLFSPNKPTIFFGILVAAVVTLL